MIFRSKLSIKLRQAFEEVVDPDNTSTTVKRDPLLDAFRAVGGEVIPMEYSQGYEIDYRGKRCLAELYKLRHDGYSAVPMLKKPTDDKTVNFIKQLLQDNPESVGQTIFRKTSSKILPLLGRG